MSEQALVEGLTTWDGKVGEVNKGSFPPPPEFDRNRFSGKWVKNNHQVSRAQESEVIRSEGVVAAGWGVWKNPKTQKPCIRTVNSGAYILMFRPKTLQQAVNAAYGNVSKKRMIQEAEGETLSVGTLESGTTQGMLTKKTLDAVAGNRGNAESSFEGQVVLNSLTTVEHGTSIDGEQAKVHRPMPDFLKEKKEK
jgi:hypothetical protein